MSFATIKIGKMVKTALFSWASLVGGTVMVTGVYYAVVLGTCYRYELGQLLKQRKGRGCLARQQKGPSEEINNPPTSTNNSIETNDRSPVSTPSGLSPVAHELIAELNAFIDQAVAEGKPREEVIMSLIGLLKKYPGLKQSLFEQAITNLITSELDMRADISLTEQEQQMLWQ